MSLVEEIKDDIKASIKGRQYLPGQRVPPQRKLAEKYGVSLITMHQALYSLSKEGWLNRGIGRGTFVNDSFPEESSAASKTRLAALIYFSCRSCDVIDPIGYFMNLMFERNFNCFYYNLDEQSQSPEKEEAFLNRCRQLNVESVFIAPTPFKNNNHIYAQMRENGTKVLLACNNSPDMSSESYCMGNYRKAGQMAVEHLVNCGCRQVCLLQDIPTFNYYHLEFIKGCRQGFIENAHRLDNAIELDLVIDNFTAKLIKGSRKELVSLFGEALKPGTGFLLAKHTTLPSLQQAMKTIGARIPEDLMCITLNGSSVKMDSTYIDGQLMKQVRRATEILTDDNIPAEKLVKELIEPTLVQGKSTKLIY